MFTTHILKGQIVNLVDMLLQWPTNLSDLGPLLPLFGGSLSWLLTDWKPHVYSSNSPHTAVATSRY